MNIEDYKKDYKAFLEDTHQENTKEIKNIYLRLLSNKYTIYKITEEQLKQLEKEL